MGGQESRETSGQTVLPDHDQLVEYVQDVMDWNAYQAAAYVEVVRNGPLEPKDIVATTDIPQGRVYDIMGTLEGEFVNVQGRQPKRYQAQHPRSILREKREEFNDKADTATTYLEQQFEVQRERQEPRHPAWVIPGISGTKRELLEMIKSAEERIQLLDRDGSWIREDEINDLERVSKRGVEVEVIGTPRWADDLRSIVTETDCSGWEHEEIECSVAIIDETSVVMRIGREHTGIKIEDAGTAKVLHSAFKSYRREANEVQPNE